MGDIADLTKTQWQHDTYYAYSSLIPAKFIATMVGWLGKEVLSTGEVAPETLRKLQWACNNRKIDQGWLGEHECEICHEYFDRGELLIDDGNNMYVAPRMIVHYIKNHFYCPPQEFINAVNELEIDK
jgi:hypothetical protein